MSHFHFSVFLNERVRVHLTYANNKLKPQLLRQNPLRSDVCFLFVWFFLITYNLRPAILILLYYLAIICTARHCKYCSTSVRKSLLHTKNHSRIYCIFYEKTAQKSLSYEMTNSNIIKHRKEHQNTVKPVLIDNWTIGILPLDLPSNRRYLKIEICLWFEHFFQKADKFPNCPC